MPKITQYDFTQEEIQFILINHVKSIFHEDNVNVQFDVSLNLNQSDNTLNIRIKAKAICMI